MTNPRFRYITESGVEVELESAEELGAAIRGGYITATTKLFDKTANRWADAQYHDVFLVLQGSISGIESSRPTIESQPQSPAHASSTARRQQTDGRAVPTRLQLAKIAWLAACAAAAILVSVGEPVWFAQSLGGLVGMLAITGAMGWLVTRYPKRFRVHWPYPATALALLTLYSEISDTVRLNSDLAPSETSIEPLRRLVDSIRVASDIPEPGNDADAILIATRIAIEGIQSHLAAMAIEYNVADDPNPTWRETPYYIRPSDFGDVRRYFVDLALYADYVQDFLASESEIRSLYLAAFSAVGDQAKAPIDDVMAGYRTSRASQDSTFAVMQAFANAAIALHDYLTDHEGELTFDRDQGMIIYDEESTWDRMVELDEEVGNLATQYLERQRQMTARVDTMMDSLSTLVR